MALVTVDQSKTDPSEIILTIKKDEFGSFVQDLLSQNKTIRRDIIGSFVLDENAIKDVLASIEQRVKLQNQVLVETVSISTSYTDGYEHKVESLRAFESLRDARQAEVCGFECNLTFLIVFPGRPKPERQEISLFVRTARYYDERIRGGKGLSFLSPLMWLGALGGVIIEIEYTDVSWGMDLENLVSQMLLARIKRRSQLHVILRIVGLLYAPIMMILGCGVAYDALKRSQIDANKQELWSAIERATDKTILEKISAKLDYIFNPALSALSFHDAIIIFLQLCGAALAVVSVALFLARQRSSFLLLNDFSKKAYASYARKNELIKIGLGMTLGVGIIASLAASFIYNYITYVL